VSTPDVAVMADRYRRVAAGFGARLDGVSGDLWDASTPCEGWTVRDLVTHVAGVHHAIRGALEGGEAALEDGGDLAALWRSERDAIWAALDDPETAGRTVGGAFGEQPFASLVGRLLCADTLVHTWDLARATGQDERLDPEATVAALDFLTPIGEGLRRPGGFGPAIEPPTGADGPLRLLCFTGRAV
jgi:uncharacterized protein (TIGR03086 family)